MKQAVEDTLVEQVLAPLEDMDGFDQEMVLAAALRVVRRKRTAERHVEFVEWRASRKPLTKPKERKK